MNSDLTSRRRAYGQLLKVEFLTVEAVRFGLAHNHLEWGSDLLTKKELDYLAAVDLRLHRDGQSVLKLGHRLCR